MHIIIHLSNNLILFLNIPPPPKKKIILKNTDLVSVQTFVNNVSESNIYNLINLNPVDDPNHNYNIISDKLQEKYEKHFPES